MNNQAVLRFETEPGRQAQVDWKEFGKQWVDGHETKLYAFVMVLGYSRMPFIRFTIDMRQSTLLACHTLAFAYFAGVPKEILYDNMRTAFEPDTEGVWHPTRRLAACAVHYGFVPQRCRVRRPETKGKVERLIGYLDHNFWARVEAVVPYTLGALNEKVLGWIDEISKKPLEELQESRSTRFKQEQPLLSALPADCFDVRDPVPLRVSRESTICYETNHYSVPPQYIGTTLQMLIHPLHRNVALMGPQGLIRSFPLESPGSHSRVFFPEDHAHILARWNHEQDRVQGWRAPRKKASKPWIDVDVRAPSAYDALIVEAREALV